MMIGFEVAPVAPCDRFSLMRSGSTESSHSFVPDAASDCNGVMCISIERVGDSAMR